MVDVKFNYIKVTFETHLTQKRYLKCSINLWLERHIQQTVNGVSIVMIIPSILELIPPGSTLIKAKWISHCKVFVDKVVTI